MSSINPSGSEKYWFNGMPFEGVQNESNKDTGTEKFWLNGAPVDYIIPTGHQTKFFLLF